MAAGAEWVRVKPFDCDTQMGVGVMKAGKRYAIKAPDLQDEDGIVATISDWLARN